MGSTPDTGHDEHYAAREPQGRTKVYFLKKKKKVRIDGDFRFQDR